MAGTSIKTDGASAKKDDGKTMDQASEKTDEKALVRRFQENPHICPRTGKVIAPDSKEAVAWRQMAYESWSAEENVALQQLRASRRDACHKKLNEKDAARLDKLHQKETAWTAGWDAFSSAYWKVVATWQEFVDYSARYVMTGALVSPWYSVPVTFEDNFKIDGQIDVFRNINALGVVTCDSQRANDEKKDGCWQRAFIICIVHVDLAKRACNELNRLDGLIAFWHSNRSESRLYGKDTIRGLAVTYERDTAVTFVPSVNDTFEFINDACPLINIDALTNLVTLQLIDTHTQRNTLATVFRNWIVNYRKTHPFQTELSKKKPGPS